MTPILRSMSLFLASLAMAGAGHAETRQLPAHPGIQLAAQELVPPTMQVNGDGSFRLSNTTAQMARVEFDVPRGQGLRCASGGDAPAPGRRFVLDEGATLVCQAEPGRYDFTVYQAGVRAKDAPSGRIEVER